MVLCAHMVSRSFQANLFIQVYHLLQDYAEGFITLRLIHLQVHGIIRNGLLLLILSI